MRRGTFHPYFDRTCHFNLVFDDSEVIIKEVQAEFSRRLSLAFSDSLVARLDM